MVSQRYAEANEEHHLLYIYANNLYGGSMSRALPYKNFQWIDPEHVDLNADSFGPINYTLEVDLDYPKELHDKHNAYPLAPERLVIDGVAKLLPNLYDKKRYIVTLRNLQFYLSKGLILKKIHRAVQYEQKSWMKPYRLLKAIHVSVLL